MPDQIDPKERFEKLWRNFVLVLQQLITVRQRRPLNKFYSAFNPFVKETFRELDKERFVKELSQAFEAYEKVRENKAPAQLLRHEIDYFVNGFLNVTGSTLAELDPPPKKKWFSQKVTAKEMINAGKTILDSIYDFLKGLLPSWVLDLLKILKEVLGIIGG